MNTDTLTSGSTVKNHISLKTVFGYRAALRTSFRSWFLVHQRVLPQACFLQYPWHLQGRKLIILRLPQACLPHQPWHLQQCQAKVWLDKHAGTCVGQIPIPQLCHTLKGKKGGTCVLLEPQKSSCWQSPPKIQNAKYGSRSRTGRPVSSRHPGKAARVQRRSCGWQSSWIQRLACKFFSWTILRAHLATQWIQSYPCKTKTSQETQRSLQKFLEPNRKPKVIDTDNSLEFGKACEDLSWNHCTWTPHRSETNEIAERAVRRVW